MRTLLLLLTLYGLGSGCRTRLPEDQLDGGATSFARCGVAYRARSTWSGSGHDLQRTFRATSSGPTGDGLRWTVVPLKGISDLAQADDGTLFAARDNQLLALSPDNGNVEWSVALGETGTVFPGAPMIGPDGTVYVGDVTDSSGRTSTGALWAVDPSTRSLRWSFPNCGAPPPWTGIPSPSPAAGSDGLVRVVCDTGEVIALQAADGSVAWRSRVGRANRGYSLAAIGCDDQLIVASETEGLFSLAASDGRERWHRDHDASWSVAVRGDGRLIVGFVGTDISLAALDPLDGSSVWAAPRNLAYDHAVGADNRVYNMGFDGIEAFDATGNSLWLYSHPPALPLGIGPVLGADGTLWAYFVGPRSGSLRAIGTDGRERRRLDPPAEGRSDAIGFLMIGDGGRLYAVSSDALFIYGR